MNRAPNRGLSLLDLSRAPVLVRMHKVEEWIYYRFVMQQVLTDHTPGWFALKVFYRKAPRVQEDFRKAGCDTYLPALISSLLFVHCPEPYLLEYKRTHDASMLFYTDLLTHRPGRIPDREMEIFRIATTIAANDPDAIYLGNDTARLCKGDRVRVTDGLYKGAEGYVKRIRHARKVLVAIQGVAVVALSNIHPQYLQKIEEPSSFTPSGRGSRFARVPA